jgi:hypothetical protein
MTASIVITDHVPVVTHGTVERDSTFLATVFALSNFDNTGVAAWRWTLLDRPIGSSAALTSTTSATPHLTPDVAGAYVLLLQTYTDAGATILDDQDQQLIGIAFATPYDWQIPGVGETSERGSRGWATSVEHALRQLQTYVATPRPSPVLWRWDEATATQFTVGKDAIGGGATALSVVQAADGPVLRVTFGTKLTGALQTWIFINDLSLAATAHVRRCIFRFRVRGFTGTQPEWYSMGPAFNVAKGIGAAFFGMSQQAKLSGGNGGEIQVAAGVATASNGSPQFGPSGGVFEATTTKTSTIFESEIRQFHNGAPVEWNIQHRCVGPSTAGYPPVPNGGGVNRAAWDADGGMTAQGSAWNALTLDTLGFAFYGTAGTTAATFDLDSLEVLRHPMDLT